jgi:aspartokinase/homoserine dehydrogenase 1
VTPNKLAWSGSQAQYDLLREAERRSGLIPRYETTVGAALPILGTVRALRKGGDACRRIESVLSGTLSYVFAQLRAGLPFSVAVARARDLGYTEPHPREDLTGADVARKLLIILREAGFSMEPESISVESLVPEELLEEDEPERFLARLRESDKAWNSRIRKAGSGTLSYVAWFDGANAGVGVKVLHPGHPLASLRPTENMVVLTTHRYDEVPLTIAGPGAGRELTASGVLTDFLAAVHDRYGRRAA